MSGREKRALPVWARYVIGLLVSLLVGTVLYLTVTSDPLPEEWLGNGTDTAGSSDANTENGSPQYASLTLTPLASDVKRVFGPAGEYYQTSDGHIYRLGSQSPVFSDGVAEVWVFGNCVIYRDALRALHASVSGKGYLCNDIIGEPVDAYTDGDGYLWLFSLEHGRIYVNRMGTDGKKYGYNNTPASFLAEGRGIASAEVFRLCGGTDGLFYGEGEGLRWCGRLSALQQTDGGMGIKVTLLSEDVSQVYGCILSGGEVYPFCSRGQETDRLYYTENGVEKTLPLPEGVSAEHLLRACYGKTVLLWSEDRVARFLSHDGNFLGSLDASDGVEFYCGSDGTYRVLMSDGVLYAVSFSD